MRLFCALRLPVGTAEALAAWQERELRAPRVRLVRRDQLHLTLAFLGGRPRAEVEAIARALREAAAGAAAFDLAPVGYRETRSVGMLVLASDPAGAAEALASDLFVRLERLGVYERERRPWLPHVTMLRFRERPRLAPPPPELAPFSPSDAALYHSVLRSSGAQYEVLEAVALGGR